MSVAPRTFVDRRNESVEPPVQEQHQFTNSHTDLTPEACDLATAIDQYKLRHRRRFITYEEMLYVIHSLGYRRSDLPA